MRTSGSPFMKLRLYPRPVAGFALACAAAVLAAPTVDPTPDAPLLVSHSRIQPHRDSDGTLKRGPSNELVDSNWSGYAIPNFETQTAYTQAQATWTVTKVSYVRPPPTCHVYNFGSFK